LRNRIKKLKFIKNLFLTDKYYETLKELLSMFGNLLKPFLFNTLVGFSLLVNTGLSLPSATASTLSSIPTLSGNNSDEYLFSFSFSTPNTLLLGLSDGSAIALSTGQSQFYPGSNNQGFWNTSTTGFNPPFNDNYLAGTLKDTVSNEYSSYNNFFTFDVSQVLGTVTSATLNLQRFIGGSSTGRPTQSYSLFDVSTDAATLNNTGNSNPTIFDDLGSGQPYGNFNVTVAGLESEILPFSLNTNAIADLNQAISLHQQFFSIGGTLTPVTTSVPESSTIVGLLLIGGLALLKKLTIKE
jgi:hypothetical protein